MRNINISPHEQKIMDFTEVIKTRRSHRKFTDEKVPEDVLKRIMDAAFAAPTWKNMQGVRYIIIDDPSQIEITAEAVGQKWLARAPMLIVVFIDPKKSGVNMNNMEYYPVDAAIALHQLILAATAEGLGTCWVSWVNEKATRSVLNIPENMRIIGITPLGYSTYEPRDIERQTFENSVYRNEFKEK